MCRKERPLSELASAFQAFPQKLINIKVAARPSLDTIEPLVKAIEQKEKEMGTTGRVLVRYSGTENKARVMVECEDEEACKRHASDIAEIIEREIGAA
jgi:phosphoglucosamine mutase